MYIAPDGTETIYSPDGSGEESSGRSFILQNEFEGPTWGACGLHDPSDKIIYTYKAGSTPMGPEYIRKPNLRCGSEEKFGYRHIKDKHMQDWENLANRVNGNWRSFVSFAIQPSLESPVKACHGSRNDILYYGMIELRNSNGLIGKRYYPRIAVGNATNDIVTAFPQKDTKGCP